jgi:hypothetical protein
MRARHLVPLAATSIAVTIGLAITVAVTLGQHPQHPQRTSTTPIAPGPRQAGQEAAPASAASSENGPLLGAVRRFAVGYGQYLDGQSAAGMHSSGTITSIAEAVDAGHIPATFRDGAVHLSRVEALEETCCSAAVTVVLANREESYPFSEELLDENGHWLVDEITPADLSMDRGLKASTKVSDPAGGEAAARSFAIAYTDLKSGDRQNPLALTAAARAQLCEGNDSLAGIRLPPTPARLTAIQFGPMSGAEFAVTATVRVGAVKETLSFLETQTATGWKVSEFL